MPMATTPRSTPRSTPKKKPTRADRAQEVALYRYALIRPLADPALSAVPSAPRRLASQVHLGPFGEPVTVSRASLDRWIRLGARAGSDALIPAEPVQVQPRTDPGVLELAADLKGTRPAPPRILPGSSPPSTGGPCRRAPCSGTSPACSCRLARTGRRRRRSAGSRPPRVTSCGVSDAARPAPRRPTQVLFALLNTTPAMWSGTAGSHGEDTLGMQAALHDAVKTHGCPQRLHSRQRSRLPHTSWPGRGAVLDIRLVHSRPGRPQGRGKIERWNRTVRDQFLVEVDPDRCGSLAEFLNRLFTAWCHQHYHRGVHLETGTTPAQRYHAEGRDRPPTPDPALLRRAFLWREQRKVTAFATVSLHGTATRSTPPWSAAPSTCCSPRST